MTDFGVAEGVIAVWGFLVGFVVWSSCFRIIEPLANWLLPLREQATIAVGVSRLLIALLLIFGGMVLLALIPLFVTVASPEARVGDSLWRDRFGISFVSSFLGLTLFGVLGRFWGTERFR